MGRTKGHIQLEGVVREAVKDGFRVEILPDGMTPDTDSQVTIWGYLSGRIRQKHITVVPGDRVKLEVSPHDFSKGRITYRRR